MLEQPGDLQDAVEELRAMVEVESDPGMGGAAVDERQAVIAVEVSF